MAGMEEGLKRDVFKMFFSSTTSPPPSLPPSLPLSLSIWCTADTWRWGRVLLVRCVFGGWVRVVREGRREQWELEKRAQMHYCR